MAVRFWLPEEPAIPSDELELVTCVASDRSMYVLLEGVPLPPPSYPDHDGPVMLWMKVVTASGQNVPVLRGGSGSSGKASRPRHHLFQAALPPDVSEALTVSLLKGEDPSPVWEMRVVPVG